ncbi:hypothetical protein ACFSCX_03160 [Bacillus salitolerans]|uniref:Abortive phage infection protein n=1 Tax=Bacillus salitolerans TaxID=1437434 RepID=A0ABW4LNF8_9BACI
MDENQVNEILTKLRNREIEEYLVEKQDFLTFRALLVKQEDFKHFRGIAMQGGNVIYTYMNEPRS